MTRATDAVSVTQADREAAASGYFAWIGSNPVIPNKMRSGEADGHSIVQAFARHRTAAQPEREAVLEGWLVERLSGEGYGKARMVLDARQYDASKPAFFVNEEARGRHRVTPLFAALTTPAPIVSRDEIVALLVDLKDRRPPDRYDSDAELSDRLDAILSRLRGAEQ